MFSYLKSKSAQLIIKIIGFALSLTGIFIVAKYQLHLIGIILLVVGIYFAAFLGTKDLK